ncbi:Hypothetical protein UVM_LOCUS79 [uncultured virus]|nr:Hypothetical protein UVM_LOCUS79 [uncultured virus]
MPRKLADASANGAPSLRRSERELRQFGSPRLAKSTIAGAGRGLFAERDYERGELVTFYDGRVLTNGQSSRSDSVYLLEYNATYVIDGESGYRGLGRHINSPAGTGRRTNVEFVKDARRMRCLVQSKRRIRKGEEFLVAYGPSYWAAQRRRRKLEKAATASLAS